MKLPRSRKAVAIVVAAVLAVVVVIAVVLSVRKKETAAEAAAAAVSSLPEAPPDLQKFRDQFTAGLKAIADKNGAEAVKQLSGFTFGSRAVEEYRLYYLAQGHELAGDEGAARVRFAQLWRRNPKMVAGPDAALKLGNLYTARGAFRNAAEVYASIPSRSPVPATGANARWLAIETRLYSGDVSGALFAARNIAIQNPRSEQAGDALAVARALSGLDKDAALPLTPSERLTRAEALRLNGDPQSAVDELTALANVAPASMRDEVQLQRGLALHTLRRFEDSIKTLEPLTSREFKVAIPALSTLSKNYRILAASINPTVYKTVKEKKQVGTIKQRVGKGKKRRTITKPKFQTVTKQIKLIDLAKKQKKDNYDRLTAERLKDLLQIKKIDDDLRLEVLNSLIARAQSKNQDDYLREILPAAVKLDPLADPALQYFWDRGWAAYARGDLQGARKTFRFVADTYTTNTNVRRQAEYWFARTSDRLGQKEEAKVIYQKLAGAPYADIYALHSVQRGATRQPNRTNPLKIEKKEDWAEIAEKDMPSELKLAYELAALSDMRDAQLEIQRNARRTNIRYAEALMADLYHSRGDLIPMYRSIRKAWPQLATVDQDQVPSYFLKMYYPTKYHDAIEKYAKQHGVDPHLVMGLILQESYYNPKAKSRVGATGLMQLMPPTAKDVAAKLGISYAAGRLENPEYNVRLGTRHLKMLIDMFNGNTYLAVASYNGGQGNVMKWRRAAPGKPMDEFIESIPFPETRGYVKRVTMLKSTYERLTL